MNQVPCLARETVNRLSSRFQQEKRELVQFLIELADFDRKQLAVELGYPSTLGCLMGELGMTESSACRRIGAARLLARLPAIEPYLAAGRLTLMGLMALKDVLDEDNAPALLERAAGLSEPAVRDLVTRVRYDGARPVAPQVAENEVLTSTVTATPVATASTEPLQLTGSPVSDQRRGLTLMVDQTFRDELAAVRDLLSHAVPSGKLEDVVLYALREVRKRHETRRYGAKKPRTTTAAEPTGRNIPPAVRREVAATHERSCDFRGADGHRCGSTEWLEHQHVKPYAKGGPSEAPNLTYFCRVHNLFQAERDFGKEVIATRIAERAPPRSPHAADVESALVNLGYKRKQAADAVTRAPARDSFDALLRECLRLLQPPGLTRIY